MTKEGIYNAVSIPEDEIFWRRDRSEIIEYKRGSDLLAACYIDHSLSQGKDVSIPSLGITIKAPKQ